MGRPETSDPMQSFRFFARAALPGGANPLDFTNPDSGQAGFQSITMPEISLEATEYREGHYAYTRKFPGVPTVSDITFMRGRLKRDTAFFDWAMTTINGGEYRADITIIHYHREDKIPGQIGNDANALKTLCHECFPIRSKPVGDLDATSAEVSMQEMDASCEWFEPIA
jgi:phage tail-like protein